MQVLNEADMMAPFVLNMSKLVKQPHSAIPENLKQQKRTRKYHHDGRRGRKDTQTLCQPL